MKLKQGAKKMNKSTYNRRFNKMKKDLIKAYNASTNDFSSDVSIDDSCSIRWGFESCIVAHDGSLGFTIWVRQDDGTNLSIQIVRAHGISTSGLVGIHARETDLSHVMDLIDTALRDGFENIYIHSIGKAV